MNYYLLFYETVKGYEAKRQPYRDSHLRLAREAQERGELIMAGAFDPADGAALLFKGETATDAEAFAEADPYVRKGLVSRWYVKKWSVVVE
ncbi:YciI-like protein [Neolewinella litorea]|uniref:YCII-related domain-containing protein n=1 Tax=Neolewinella litorea TaxID=2562452 RepID=A0A4S4NK76_9BACT|nr:YciI-like protein [Neolewinella litorea]THH39345.1 hypothetical protein E4021_11355 [Neolewinella litorea]